MIAASLVVASLFGVSASAQLPAPGDLDPRGRVLAKVVVMMVESGAYSRQVSGLRFFVVPENGDRVVITTDDAGVASVWLERGSYHFATAEPLSWQGRAYSWDMVTAVRPGMPALRLSQDNATKVDVLPPPLAAAMVRPQPAGSSSVSTSQGTRPVGRPATARRGYWFNGGVAYGALGCSDCDGYRSGLSGGMSIGATLNPQVLLGVGSSGWRKSENGTTLNAGLVDARVLFYPSVGSGFFLTGGIGVGRIGADVFGFGTKSETGIGGIVGIGMDFKAGPDYSLTPFWNAFGVRTSHADVAVAQIGLGVSIRWAVSPEPKP